MSSLEEVWKDIPGYEGWYQVSNLGRVKRIKKVHCNHGNRNIIEREHILTPTKDRKGYLIVILSNDGNNKKHCKVHRLVAEAFIPNIEKKPQVDHINRIKNDNRVCNLRWVTNSENQYNSTNTRLLNYKGEMIPLTILCNMKNIKRNTVLRRLKSGWSVEDAVDKPVDTRFYKKKLGGI